MSGVEFEIPVKTISETNVREHWRARHARRKDHRRVAAIFANQWVCVLPPKPWLITMTRYGVRRLDTGNLGSSFKGSQDGLCDAIGIDDGDEAHEWRYRQVERLKAEGEPGVGVRIEALATT